MYACRVPQFRAEKDTHASIHAALQGICVVVYVGPSLATIGFLAPAWNTELRLTYLVVDVALIECMQEIEPDESPNRSVMEQSHFQIIRALSYG